MSNLPKKITPFVKISEAAQKLGVSIDTLRRWEKAGKIEVIRTPGGTRLYSISALKELTSTPLKYQRALQTQAVLEKPLKPQLTSVEELIQHLEGVPQAQPHLPGGSENLELDSFIDERKPLPEEITVFSETELPSLRGASETTKQSSTKETLHLRGVKAHPRGVLKAGGLVLATLFLTSLILARLLNFNDPISTKLAQIFNPNQPETNYLSVKNQTLNPNPSSSVLAASTSNYYLGINSDVVIEGDLAVSKTINGLTLTPNDDGFSIAGGSSASRRMTVVGGDVTLDQDVSTKGSPSFSSLKLTSTSKQISMGGAGTLSWTPTGTQLITLPNATGTVLLDSATQTITNKTISGSSNTLTSIPNSALSNHAITVTAGTNISGGGEIELGASGTLSLKDAISLTSVTASGNVSASTLTGTSYLTLSQTTAPAVLLDKLYNQAGQLVWNGLDLTSGGSLPIGTSGQTIYHTGLVWNATSNLFNNGTSVGIGTVSPGGKLGVAGGVAIGTYSDAAPPNNGLIVSGNVGIGNSSPQGALQVLTGALFVGTNGNVGIGTTAPGQALEVNGAGYFSSGTYIGANNTNNLISSTSTGAGSTQLFIGNLPIVTSTGSGGSLAGSTNQVGYFTGTNTLGGSNNFWFDGSNVGIGTTAPSSKLQVIGDIAGTTFNGNTITTGTGTLTLGANTISVGGNLTTADAFTTTGAFPLTLTTTALTTATLPAGVDTLAGLGTNQTFTGTDIFNGNLLFGGSTGILASNGNIGVGTTSPIGALHVVGQCVTGDTLLKRRRRKKGAKGNSPDGGDEGDSSGVEEFGADAWDWEDVRIDEIQPGDEILTLDEKTGKFVVSKINALQEMGIQDVYQLITESGKKIRTTGNHPYLAKKPSILGPSGTFEADQSNRIEDLTRDSFIALSNTATGESYTASITKEEKKKAFKHYQKESRFFGPILWARMLVYLIRRYSIHDSKIILDLEYPSYEKVIDQILYVNGERIFTEYQSIGKNSFAHEAVYEKATGKKLAHKKATGALTQYVQVAEDMLHPEFTGIRTPSSRLDNLYHKFDSLSIEQADWIKVYNLELGWDIATVDGWEKIISLKKVGREQVFDIEVSGTHNFVGNNIVAHNTIIFGAGEGSTPTTTTLRGASGAGANVAGANFTFDASNGTGSGGSGALIFRTAPVAGASSTANTLAEIMRITPGGNVGIGTTNPLQKLEVTGAGYFSTGAYIGANNTNNLISSTSTGAGSTQLYIGNLPIVTSTGSGGSLAGATNQVGYFTGTNTLGGSNNFWFNGSNVGIGTTGPSQLFQIGPNTSAGSTALVFTSGGNLGIGTTGPTFPLQVQGNIGIGNGGSIFNAVAGSSAGGIRVEESTTNLVTNPSFETGTTGWSTTEGTFSRVTLQQMFGQASAKLTDTGGYGYVASYTTPSLTAGTTYTISFYAKVDPGTTGSITPKLEQLSPFSTICQGNTNNISTSSWKRFSFTCTPSLTQAHRLDFYSQALNGTFYLDGVQIEQKSYATSYTDGSLGPGYAWTGTAHASTSTRSAGTFVADNAGFFGAGLGINQVSSSPALFVNQGGSGPAALFTSGNVGIGTTNPLQALEVNGAGYFSTGTYIGANNTNNLISTASTGAGSAQLYIGNLPIATVGGGGSGSITGATNQVGYFTGANTLGGSNNFWFNGTNVGIGTTAPQGLLSIAGGDVFIDASDQNAGTLPNGSVGPGLRFGGVSTGEGIASNRTVPGNQYGLDFYTSYINRMAITNTGNVGIGTTNPLQKLDLVTGSSYGIAGTSVLNATTLGTGVLTSSLTTVGALNAGSITSGFGAIDTGADNIITTGTMGVAATTTFTGAGGTFTSLANSGAYAQTGVSANTFTGTSTFSNATYSALFTGGNVGIGTTSPAGALHVAGQCVTGDTLLKRRRRKKGAKGNSPDGGDEGDSSGVEEFGADDWDWEDVRIDEIQPGDEILTLDEKTGKFVVSKVKALQEMGIHQTHLLVTDSGKMIRTTANHPYLTRETKKAAIFGGVYQVDQSPKLEQLNQDSFIALADKNTQFIIKISRKHKKLLYQKYQDKNKQQSFAPETFAKAINMLLSLSKIQPFELKIDNEYTGYETRIREIITLANPDILVSFHSLGHSSTSFAHWAAYKSFRGEYAADLELSGEEKTKEKDRGTQRVGLGIVAPIPLNRIRNTRDLTNGEYHKFDDLSIRSTGSGLILSLPNVSTAKWLKVHDIKPGMDIATLDGWEKVVAIKEFAREQVFDIEVEGTHNFVGNNIVAHNTYLMGNVGIGTTLPAQALEVLGAGYFSSGTYIGANNTNNLISTASTGAGSTQLYIGNLPIVTSTGSGGSLAGATNQVGYFTGTNVLGGSNNFWFDGTNVGIGTTAPGAYKLAVSGDVNITGGYYINGALASGTLWAAYGSNIANTNSGNVGIGTTSPGTRLYVAGDSFTQISADGALASGNNYYLGGVLKGAIGYGPTGYGGNHNTGLYFDSAADITFGKLASDPLVTILNSGNVGIGTTAPNAPLEIYRTTPTQQLRLSSAEVAPIAGTGPSMSFEGARPLASIQGIFDRENGNYGNLLFFTRTTDALGLQEKMRILYNGYVGIGTTAPPTIVSARQDSTTYGAILTLQNLDTTAVSTQKVAMDFNAAKTGDATAVSLGLIEFGKEQEWTSTATTRDAYFSLALTLDGARAEKLRVTSAGNVGIGTVVPSVKLQSAGTIAVAPNGYAPDNTATEAKLELIGSGSTSAAKVSLIQNWNYAKYPVNLLNYHENAGSNFKIQTSYWNGASVSTIDALLIYGGTTSSVVIPQGGLHVGGTSDPGIDNLVVDGNVGIGTTNPATKLDVAGTGQTISGNFKSLENIQGPTTYAGLRLGYNSATNGGVIAATESATGYPLEFWMYNHLTSSWATPMVLTDTGNVGIGTTNPVSKLQVAGGSILLTNSSADPYYYIGDTDAGTGGTFGYLTWDSTNDLLQLGLSTGGDVLSINESGNVGIGTTGPFGLLTLPSGDGNSLGGINFTDTTTTGGTTANSRKWQIRNDFAVYGDLAFAQSTTKAGTTFAAKMLIDNNGNVGIGTTGPAFKVDVRNSTSIDTVLALGNSVDANVTQLGKQGSSAYGANGAGDAFLYSVSPISIMSNSAGGIIKFSTGGNAEKVRIENNGNVGIGTTNPLYKLSVAGDINTTGDIRKNGTAYTNPDYVFQPAYNLMSLGDLKSYTSTNFHLPGVPSSEDIRLNGIALFEQTRLNLEKTEEAYLYLFNLNDQVALFGGQLAAIQRVQVDSTCVTGDTKLRRRKKKSSLREGDEVDDEAIFHGMGRFPRSLRSLGMTNIDNNDSEFEDVRIDEIEPGDEILTLDETTGKLISSRVNALMNMGVQEVYEIITKSGKRIRTTDNHPYLVQIEELT